MAVVPSGASLRKVFCQGICQVFFAVILPEIDADRPARCCTAGVRRRDGISVVDLVGRETRHDLVLI